MVKPSVGAFIPFRLIHTPAHFKVCFPFSRDVSVFSSRCRWSIKVQLGCTFDFCAIKFKPVHNHVRDRPRCYGGRLLSGEDLDVHHFMPCRQKGLASRYLCQRGLSSARSPFSPGQMGFMEKLPSQHNAGCVGFCLSFALIPH